ncbi:helix-turn-helix domain-containing protein [Acrocarpospora macrocephala]|uniref:Integrase/transposase n=1 Tax=Acrocarpospora macrocephala TaxID=150177 RepID=A0A5M3WPC1_9ACTN|nr:DDE-type integrase/transposase/recombinase [Acrocarpospora macrocephala]GES10390.1 integrase/transposase [Acrocarpospora macrocephala]
MSWAGVRFGVGTRLVLDGETVEIVELVATKAGNEVIVKDMRGGRRRMSQRELLFSDRARVIPDVDGPEPDDPYETAGTVLGRLTPAQLARVAERAAHLEEVLTGYRSGSEELVGPGEPRAEYDPDLPLGTRYAAKAKELGVVPRTVERWVHDYRRFHQAGLAEGMEPHGAGRLGQADPRWVEMALEVMAEYTSESQPTMALVAEQTAARLQARYGADVVKMPSRASSYRYLEELDHRVPTFHGSSKRRRESADRPKTAYGRLRPTRPGEYVLLDTTRSDVFALDPITLRWVQAEITVAMDWYDRAITGLRVTPVSTKAVDVGGILYQTFRPRPVGKNWPAHAVWPEHGLPRGVLMDVDAFTSTPVRAAAVAPRVPETIVIDHGKVFASAHVTSVCRRLGISIQPARLRTGRDKGPIERFFRTLRQGLLERLPGYKGPDVYSRGLDPEGQAFLFLDELEAIIAKWIAVVYHHRPHRSLVDPHMPGLKLSPAMMFEHGVARSGYVEVPRNPDLGFEFLKVEYLPVHHYGVEINRCRYNGDVLEDFRGKTSPFLGAAKGRWPFHVNIDDITKIYFRHPDTRQWHALDWEHAPMLDMPFSLEALEFSRRLAAAKYTYPDDKLALADLLKRWNLGLEMSRTERRMALRLSREQAAVELPDLDADPVPSPASVRKALGGPAEAGDQSQPPPAQEAGDDDDADELDLAPPDRTSDGTEGMGDPVSDFEDDFYATALKDVDD